MNRRTHWLAAGVAVLLVVPAHGQEPAKKPEQEAISDQQRALFALTRVLVAEAQKPLYEDIEIMRRILEVRMSAGTRGRLNLNAGFGGGMGMGGMGMGGMGMGGMGMGGMGMGGMGMGGMGGGGLGGMGMGGMGMGGMGMGGMGGGSAASWGVPSSAPSVEGVYLRGHGIIYTMTLAAPKGDPRPQAIRYELIAPLSDWEQARKQLRGEKIEPQPEAMGIEVKKPTLGDTILDILAENGKNFAHLAQNEVLAVVVTFREPTHEQALAERQAALASATYDALGAQGRSEEALRQKKPTFVPVTGPGTLEERLYPLKVEERSLLQHYGEGHPKVRAVRQAIQDATELTQPKSARDFKLLGDLHLKQGKPRDALANYESAVRELTQRDMQGDLGKEILSKMAQAALQIGDHERAKQLLEGLVEWAGASKQTSANKQKDKDTWVKPPAPGLPAKLTISASKKLLDQVGQGKMSFDDFKKQVSVEYLTFTPEKKAAPETKKKDKE